VDDDPENEKGIEKMQYCLKTMRRYLNFAAKNLQDATRRERTKQKAGFAGVASNMEAIYALSRRLFGMAKNHIRVINNEET